jgi:hypothetical protein
MKNLIFRVVLIVLLLIYVFLYLGLELELKFNFETGQTSINRLINTSFKIRNISNIRLGIFFVTIVCCFYLSFRKKQ